MSRAHARVMAVPLWGVLHWEEASEHRYIDVGYWTMTENEGTMESLLGRETITVPRSNSFKQSPKEYFQ